MTTKKELLLKRRAEIDRRLRELLARDARKSLALERRQKLVIGEWILKNRPDIAEQIVFKNLLPEKHRQAFENWEGPKQK